ncbi:MAG: HD family phosphohydrolase [Dehalobacterium sp.]
MEINNHQEYLLLVEDILNNEKFLELINYYHHNSSIMEHVLSVSFLSYLVCKKLNLDYVSGARGGLLHDFFLYDWREYKKNPLNKNHGLNHPKIALENSHQCFELNEIECDIILKHMWPKVIGWPKYWESLVVSLVDKYCACNEFLTKLAYVTEKTKSPRIRRYIKKISSVDYPAVKTPK